MSTPSPASAAANTSAPSPAADPAPVPSPDARPAPVAAAVLADVDTGMDDALALVFLARDPRINLLAVTCVAGNTDVDQVLRNTLDVQIGRASCRERVF